MGMRGAPQLPRSMNLTGVEAVSRLRASCRLLDQGPERRSNSACSGPRPAFRKMPISMCSTCPPDNALPSCLINSSPDGSRMRNHRSPFSL